MKKKIVNALALALMITMSLANTSCGKDDDPTPDNPQNNTTGNNQGTTGNENTQGTTGNENQNTTGNENQNTTDNGNQSTPVVEKLKVVIDGKEQEVEKNTKITLPEFENEKFGYDAEYKDNKGNSYKPGDEISVVENLKINTVYTAQDHTYTMEEFRKFMLAADKAKAYDEVYDVTITDLNYENQSKLYENFDDYNFSKVKLNVTIAANDDLTEIKAYAFSNIKNIKKLVLPEGLISIERNAFQKNGIQEIVLPESLKDIEIQAFSDCYSLKSVTFPAGIVSFGSVLFQNCESIETITILSENILNWGYNIFEIYDFDAAEYVSHPTLKTVYVKASMLDWFKEKFPQSANLFKAL